MTMNAFEKAGEAAPDKVDNTVVIAADTSLKPAVSLPPEVADLIGEGKKYATLEAALKSIPHAQAHITALELETRDLRARRESVEAILANVNAGQTSEDTTSLVNEDSVAERVMAKLSANDKAKVAQSNLIIASDTLATKAGSMEAAAVLIANKARELGLSTNDLQVLASRSPAAFLAYFNESTPKNLDKTPMSMGGVNTEALKTTSHVAEGTYAWHQAQRKAQGDRWYFSEGATAKRLKDVTKLGNEKFYGANQ